MLNSITNFGTLVLLLRIQALKRFSFTLTKEKEKRECSVMKKVFMPSGYPKNR